VLRFTWAVSSEHPLTGTQPSGPPDPQILDAARAAVSKYGYAGLSLERIAAEAGLSRVTLHRRGFSTDEIFDELVERGMTEQREALWPVLAAEGSGAERLRLALETIVGRCEKDLDLLLAISARSDARRHLEDGPAATSRRVSSAGQVLVDPLQILVREGVADGSLREVDAEVEAVLLLVSVAATYVRLRTAFGVPAKTARERVIDHSLAALVTPSS
jgi:AcrR family transcriptional regulator